MMKVGFHSLPSAQPFKQGKLQAARCLETEAAFAVFDNFFFQPFFIVQLLIGVVRIVFF